jgi:hypothetical protein
MVGPSTTRALNDRALHIAWQIDPHRLIERTARAPAHGVEDRGSWRCSWSFNGAVQKMSALLRLLTAAFGTHRPFNDVRSYVGSRG